jgi:sensor histidine kinase regulating citrate/malate metabolism
VHLSSQKEQHQYLEHTYREVRKLSHDMKHYLAVIYSLLQQGKTAEAMHELEQRQVEIAENHVIDTGYPVLNSVLAYKTQQAKEKQIQTQIFWNLTEPLQIHQTDLALILANGLDNAIEATEQITDVPSHISITAENKLQYVVIRISNNTAHEPQIINGKITTTKQDKQWHGFGLESIHHLALQYDGESSTTYQDDTFILTVMLKNRKNLDSQEAM